MVIEDRRSIPKEDAEIIMKNAGYDCALENGILRFKGVADRRGVDRIKRKLKEIRYSASYAFDIQTEETC